MIIIFIQIIVGHVDILVFIKAVGREKIIGFVSCKIPSVSDQKKTAKVIDEKRTYKEDEDLLSQQLHAPFPIG